jgi:pimeloyl-ACP methyl ester carboxylesterase
MALRKRYWIPALLLLLIAAAGTAFYLHPVDFFNAQVDFQMRANGASSRWVTVNGYKIHYYVSGPEDGAPAVLVHGLSGRGEQWRPLLPYFEHAGLRVYMPDLPGFGQSEQPADFSYSVSDQAGVVVGFMDALGLQKADLAGHSMGGWIVQLIAARHPERVRRLLIFDSVGLHMEPNWDTNLFVPANAAQLDQIDELLMPNPPKPPEFIANDILAIARKNSWVIHRAMDAMLAGRDTTDEMLPQLRMPVLIVWGDLDRIAPLSEGEKMHALIRQSRLEVIAGCGHLAPQQCAHQIGPKMADFLR